MMMKTIGLAALVLSLSWCASLLDPNGASSNFTCRDPNNPDSAVDGVVCKTPFAVYKSTHGQPEVRESDLPIGVSMSEYKATMAGKSADAPSDKMPHPALGMTYHLPGQMFGQDQPQYARPVRAPAQIMRIWIAPWIDKRDDLHLPSHIYTEIQPRRWVFGVEAGRSQGVIVPTKDLARVPSGRVEQGPATGEKEKVRTESNMHSGTELPGIPAK